MGPVPGVGDVVNIAFFLLVPVVVLLAWFRPWRMTFSDVEGLVWDDEAREWSRPSEPGSSSPDPVERQTQDPDAAVVVGHD